MTPEERAGQEALEDLSGHLVTRRDFERVAEEHHAHITALRSEIETLRLLGRYQQRTWFWIISMLMLLSAALGDVAKTYATTQWWDLIFWTSPHGDTGIHWTQAAGFGWQFIFFAVMLLRAQVPGWLKGTPIFQPTDALVAVLIAVNEDEVCTRWYERKPWSLIRRG